MEEILVFCDKDDVAFELLAKGIECSHKLSGLVAAMVLGKNAEIRTQEYFSYGAQKVYLVKDEKLVNFEAEIYADALYQIAEKYHIGIILIGSTRRGKELAPRLAEKLNAGCITDAIGIEIKDGDLVIERYALGGNTICSESIKGTVKVISVMPRTFQKEEKKIENKEVIFPELSWKEPRTKVVEKREKKAEAVNLEEAEALVCVGRGLTKKEDMPIIQKLADALKAEIGCTKFLASDFQWLSEERIVGLSGKKCKPGVCFSIGISGQIQHTVGMRGSKIIVAINKDKSAPIFKMSDYGIVGDLYQVVPRLIEKLSNYST